MLTTSYTKVWSKVWGAFRLTGLKETPETVVETWVYDRALDPGAKASDTVTVTAVKPMKAKKTMKAAMKAMKKVPKAGNKAKKAMKKKAAQK